VFISEGLEENSLRVARMLTLSTKRGRVAQEQVAQAIEPLLK